MPRSLKTALRLLPLCLLVLVVWREKPWTGAAWWTYKYSLLYLALLFVAMVIDRKI